MSTENKTYRHAAKGIAIFGGVQIFQILVSIIRGKFVAMFLGASGMGISALLTSTVYTIIQFSGLGLNMGAVKDISQANESGDEHQLSKVVYVFRRWVWVSGVLGGLICLIGAPWLSEFAFGNADYTIAFMLLSVMVLLTTLATADTSLLQGVRRLKDLAKTSIIGSVVGLVVGIPLYYFFGVVGIVPAMIVLAAATYFTNRYYAKKVLIKPIELSVKETAVHGKEMLVLGIILMLSSVFGTISIYLTNAFISRYGSVADVGLFQAASSITNQYVGVVFAAMAVDYFPRLSSIATDNTKVREIVNQQMEIVLLIVAPLILAIIITTPLIIRILLTSEFLVITPLLRWLGIAIFFKAASFPMGYIAFAKGDKRLFFWLEGVASNVMTLSFAILGYIFFGLIGLGVATLTSYVVYFVTISIIVTKRYDFSLSKAVWSIYLPLMGGCLSAFIISIWIEGILFYALLIPIFVAVTLFSYQQLNRRIDIGQLLKSKFFKKR